MNGEMLAAIIERLGEKLEYRSPFSSTQLIERMLEVGWGLFPDIEDLLLNSDRRLYGLDIKQLAEYLDSGVRSVYWPPKYKNSSCIGFPALAVTDVAALLIFLETLGFEVDPTTLVQALYENVCKKLRMTVSELDIYRYSAFKEKSCLEIRANDSAGSSGQFRESSFRTRTRYRITVLYRGDSPVKLTVRGPKYKKRPDPVEVKCEYCGYVYTKGDRESADYHRSHHARVKRILEPKPLKKLVLEMENAQEGELVTYRSHLWKHHEMYERALLFKREFQYDFVQWGAVKDTDPNAHGYLLNDPEKYGAGVVVGACAFRLRGGQWGLQWIWIAPFARRTGVLSKYWPKFVNKYGQFAVEPPLSEAMSNFLGM